MKVLKQGAEAVIYSEKIDGSKFLVKERIPKKYRLRQIDEKLRKTRTRQEMKLMREARGHGVLTPKIVSSDEYKIVMEDLGTKTVRDYLKTSKSPSRTMSRIGEDVGKMHSIGIVHGDLTTSNMVIRGKDVYFIDFGLGQFSRKTEDFATDLSVLREALTATHSRIAEKCWKAFLKGYIRTGRKPEDVLKRLDKLESRGRYKSR